MENSSKSDQHFWHMFSSSLYILLVALAIVFLNSQGKLTKNIPVFDFVILILATYRLIRLFTYDMVTDFVRDYLAKFESGPGRTLWHLIDCPWCTGVWMALVTFFLYFAHPLFWYFLLIMAMAGTATFVQITIWKIGRED
ncbi:MAG: hypothetical protein QG620_277 [Patescibacteria group bacterium]|nr:hypothetical protein [Patescibacteria group bacterium]